MRPVFKEGLKQVVPALAARKPLEFVGRLCDWLKAMIEATKHPDPESDFDLSYIWRPAIEEHEQNHDSDFAGVMVGFVRQGFEHAIRGGELPLAAALDLADGYGYLVFKRVRLHLINEFADQNPELARQTMLDEKLFEDHRSRHEYAMLVGRRLDLLSVEQKGTWFGWIDAGPNMLEFDESFKKNAGRDATDEDRQNRIDYWKFERLHWVRGHLEGARREFYQRMLADRGEPELADLNFRVGPVRFGTVSPMTVEDLAAMTFEQAVETVCSWHPEEPDFMGPDIEGLASTFGQYVASSPEQFSAKAPVLVGRPAIFVRGFISRMAEAAKAGCEIAVSPVLELCHWVVQRPVEERTVPEQEDGSLVDANWQWTRDEVSRLVEDVCQAMGDAGPRYPLAGTREPMWQLLAALCRDRTDSYVLHDISQDDPRVRDYLDLGINSPRGKAVEAGLEYARWVANHIKESAGKQEVIPGGFEAMPEVREMLEWQIAPENASFETMSVIGSRIGVVCWIDKQWLARNADRLFRLPGIEETPLAAQGWAAWNAFLVWVRPHTEFYRLFGPQFAYAVEQAAKVQPTEHGREQPMNHLGEHLMLLYGRGQLGLEDDGGLLRRFVGSANADIRRHAIGFVGQSIEGEGDLPSGVVERFVALWEFYWLEVGRKDAEEKPDAWLFGTWFSSGRFPDEWALAQLEQFVEAAPTAEPDHAVAEQLAKIAQADVARSVRILDRMIRGDQEGWHIHGWLDSAKQILTQAMATPGEPRTRGVELINYLGRRGLTDFEELLRQ